MPIYVTPGEGHGQCSGLHGDLKLGAVGVEQGRACSQWGRLIMPPNPPPVTLYDCAVGHLTAATARQPMGVWAACGAATASLPVAMGHYAHLEPWSRCVPHRIRL